MAPSEPSEPSETTDATHDTSDGATSEAEWRRRRRLAEVFGDALPDTTSDERDPGPVSDSAEETAQDRWLRSQVPPHHG